MENIYIFTYFESFSSCKYVHLILPINVIQVRIDQGLMVKLRYIMRCQKTKGISFYFLQGQASDARNIKHICAEVRLCLDFQNSNKNTLCSGYKHLMGHSMLITSPFLDLFKPELHYYQPGF